MRAIGAAAFAAIAIIGAIDPVQAEDKPAAGGADLFAPLYRKLKDDRALQALWRRCPADIYRRSATAGTASSDVERAQCQADPASCHAACFQEHNENACFSLALAIEARHDKEASLNYQEPLFARACASGSAGGCTNRAAGIRNGQYENDPFTTKPERARNACLFRSFQVACLAGDAWGCTMYGQSYENGEGVAADSAKAAEAYRKSCQISAAFAACDYARSQLKTMGLSP